MEALKTKKDTEKRRLTRQIQQLKRINEDQRQEMLKMVEAHARLQQAAAEMNRLRLSTTRNLLSAADGDLLSQQLSQIAADLVDEGSLEVSSPVSHRSKRSRQEETPARKSPRAPLSALRNQENVTPLTMRKQVKMVNDPKSCSPTQSQESPVKKMISGSEYGDFIPDEGSFSQFDI